MSSILQTKQRRGIFGRMLASLYVDTGGDVVADSGDSVAEQMESAPEVGVDTLVKVQIQPDSPETKAQSLLQARSISKRFYTIGRTSGGDADYVANPVDFGIRQAKPFTISRQHCAIELGENSIKIKDLGGRYGTVVDGVRVGGRSDAATEVELARGEHHLIFGPRDSCFRFKLIVE